MPSEPAEKTAVVFVDGQNLFHSAKEAFGYTFPNYDVYALAQAVCGIEGWKLREARFYTGVPDVSDSAFWNYFWTAKMGAMGHRGIRVYSRPLRYRNKAVRLSDGTQQWITIGEEKGVDVRIALDVIRLAHRKEYDVAVIFSQDQDLSEAVDELRVIAAEQNRWIKAASAYPISPTVRNKRGINHSDWITIDRKLYDACIDPKDYRAPPTIP